MLTRQRLHRYIDARARAYVGISAVSWNFEETVKTKNMLRLKLQRVILISSNGAAPASWLGNQLKRRFSEVFSCSSSNL